MNRLHLPLAASLLAACAAPDANANAVAGSPAAPDTAPRMKPEDTEVREPEPAVVTPGTGAAAPSDATVLFDGTDPPAWSGTDGGDPGWKVEEGALTAVAGSGDIRTRQSFGSVQLHIEWRTPSGASGEGRGRGNSDVYLMEKYELQALDSCDNRTRSNGQAGSIRRQYALLVNASRPPGRWQTCDIVFDAPRFAADESLVRPACMTALQNGVPVHERGNPVSCRDIWIRSLGDEASG